MRGVEVHQSKAGVKSYRVRFRLNAKQTSETFADEKAATEFASLLDVIGPAAALNYIDRRAQTETRTPTLDEWAERHFDSATGITDGTRGEYRRMYRRAWSPLLGKLPLDSITREAVARALNTLSSQYADKTMRNYSGLLFNICKGAVRSGYIPMNPCEDVKVARRTEHERKEMRLLSQDEFNTLVGCVPERWRPLVYFLAGTGCRWGEAAALTVADVDLKKSTVRLHKGVKWARGGDKGGIGPTKTPKSRRTVALPRQLVSQLRDQVAGKKRADYVFTATRGGPVRQGNFYERIWAPACEDAGLKPRPRIHDLRHCHASWLIAAGVPLPVIQQRLGHESITTTVDTYGHLAPDLQQAAANAANAVFAIDR